MCEVRKENQVNFVSLTIVTGCSITINIQKESEMHSTHFGLKAIKM